MESSDYKRSIYYFPLRKPVTVTMIILTVFVFGYLSYRLLPINIMPDITYPSLTVRTEFPGSAPEEVESTVTKPLEQSLGVVRNLVEIESSSRAEYSDITLEFDWSTDMNQATQDVREKLDLVFLPEDVKPPLILRYDPTLDPLIRIGVTSDTLDLMTLRELCDDHLTVELEKLNGVAAVRIMGGEESEIKVELQADELQRLNLSTELVSQRLAAENINIAGGRLQEGKSEFIVRTLNEYKSLNEIGQIYLKSQGNRIIRLEDIANIEKKPKEKTSITKVSELESVELQIFKESDANPITVSEYVKHRIFGIEDKEKKEDGKAGKEKKEGKRQRKSLLPLKEVMGEDVHIYVLSDQSEFIRFAVDEVKKAAIYGGILSIIVLLFFLGRLRDTIVVALVIPISLVCTFAAMHIAKVSLNIMSLGGLALGIGMMVDNAIVVVESIYKHREQGIAPFKAAVLGTQAVGGAVTASTITTVVVFFPIVFVTGIAGQVFGDMALAVIISLSVSLIVALFFIPMLITHGVSRGDGSYTFREIKAEIPVWMYWEQMKRDISAWKKRSAMFKFITVLFFFAYEITRLIFGTLVRLLQWLFMYILWFLSLLIGWLIVPLKKIGSGGNTIGRTFRSLIKKLTNLYLFFLRGIIRQPFVIVLLAFGFTAYSIVFVVPRLGTELIPSMSQGTFEVHLTLPVGNTIEQTSSVIAPIESKISTFLEVDRVSSRIGSDAANVNQSEYGSNIAIITVKLKNTNDIELVERATIKKIRKTASKIPSLDVSFKRPTLFTFKKPVELIIKNENLTILKGLARKIENQFNRSSYLTDVESSVKSGYPEVVLVFDRQKLARIGLNSRTAAQRVKTALHGTVPTKFREDDKRVDLRVIFDESDRGSLDDLESIIINPGQPVPLQVRDVADIEVREGPAEIRHFSNNRSAVITTEIADTDLGTATTEITRIMQNFNLRQGYDYIISGQKREMSDSLKSLRMALYLAIFLVYVVMASQFESFKAPFLILLTIPFAVSAVFPFLQLFGISISIMVFLGLIVLSGIVVNDSIVLVDLANDIYRREGSAVNAVLRAGERRFRPILMTTLTTILALLPMALSMGEGMEIRRPLAITVIIGLVFSTMVSLLIIPSLFVMVNRDSGKE